MQSCDPSGKRIGHDRWKDDAFRHASPPVYQQPELRAEAPRQVWSWDITKLMGPMKRSYFYLSATLADCDRPI